MGTMDTDWKRVIAAALDQGWRLRRTSDGFQLMAPDGMYIVTIHGTPSDRRAIRNAIAHLRQGGFEWPPGGGRPKGGAE
jgi:hypothetical protein